MLIKTIIDDLSCKCCIFEVQTNDMALALIASVLLLSLYNINSTKALLKYLEWNYKIYTMHFEDPKTLEPIIKALKEEKYSKPPSIQEKAIPLILNRNYLK